MRRSIDPSSLNIVIIGLAITSSWGNGHATTYRSLVKGLHALGHRVLFMEQDQPWYAAHRDAPQLPHCDTQLYRDLHDLRARFAEHIRSADAVIVGSYVRDGVAVSDWVLNEARNVRAFYDIDTPLTLASLHGDACEYLRARQIHAFDIVLSFAGGPTLTELERVYGARHARALYCSVDTARYLPGRRVADIDLGYMGTYSADRQPALETLLCEPARALSLQRFMVVGAQYPSGLVWPANVLHVDHLPPSAHPSFYNRQRWTLNITRASMRAAGYSPSVRLFEAAACATPIISDAWPGLADVFEPGKEIAIVQSSEDVLRCLLELDAAQAHRMARAARERVLGAHTSEQRARELLGYLHGVVNRDLPTPERQSVIV